MIRQINAPLIGLAAIAYIIAWLVARRLDANHPELLRRIDGAGRAWRNALIALGIVYFLVYSYLSVHRYHKLMSGAWDVGIFDSLFYNTLHGKAFADFRGPFDHFQPIYFVLVPFYALWQDARMLLVLQTLVMTLPAWPLYLLAREVTGNKVLAGMAGILYLLYPLTGEGNLYDIHMLSFSPLCFFFMLYFMVLRKWRWYWLFLVLLLCVKESECIIVFGAGLYLFSRRQYLAGALTAAVAVAWFFAVTLWALPAITGTPFRHFGRFTGLADVARWAYDTYLGQLTAAAYFVRVVAVCLFTLVPLSFLITRKWRPFVLVFGPAFAVNMVAKTPFQNNLFGHYGITITSAVLGGTALALEGIRLPLAGDRPSKLPVFVTVSAIILNVALSYPANERFVYPKAHVQVEKCGNVLSLPIPVTKARLDFYRITPHAKLFWAVKDAIPSGSIIVAQNTLATCFVKRCKVKAITVDRDWDVPADFYLFDMKETYGSIDDNDWKMIYRRLVADPSYVPFIYLDKPDSPDFIFFSKDAAWTKVYDSLRRRLRENPGDEGAALAVAAVDESLRIKAPAAQAVPQFAAPAADSGSGPATEEGAK
jgi:uncharacterized membrane protein